jgi:dihydrofolate reductase
MTRVFADITMSLDGFVAGPEPTLEDPLGAGGMQLHEWAFRLAAWRAPHGLEGGEVGPESPLVEENQERSGAVVMGRKMFSGGSGPWEGDPNARGWWGDDPPFHKPVFVVTHHEREPLRMEGGTTFTFVTAGVERAVELAREASAGKDVAISGGGSVVTQCLQAGLLGELVVHVAPLLLGNGTRLFDQVPSQGIEITQVIDTPLATHIRYALGQ